MPSLVDNRFGIGYDENNVRGVVSSEHIPAGTLLIHTPHSLVITTTSDDEAYCKRIVRILEEMKLGSQSKWYTQFQYDDGSSTRIPSRWDRHYGAISEPQGLPPTGQTHSPVDRYQRSCLQGREPTGMEWKAMNMYVTRTADIGLVPMYSTLNHHNGKVNTRSERDGEGGLSVFALHDIPPNTPLYLTYARSGLDSSVDVFNTYGFVEDYPQLWRWSDDDLDMMLQENPAYAKSRYSDRYSTPNYDHYEILVVSTTLAAILPSKKLTGPLGNHPVSLKEWEQKIKIHHNMNLDKSHTKVLHDSAKSLLSSLPTSIEQDEAAISVLSELQKGGKMDDYRSDWFQAIECRLAFKKALKLAIEVAENDASMPASKTIKMNLRGGRWEEVH